MSRPKIVEAVKEGRVLVSDGAWGTVLQQKGLQPGECPELWNVEKPDAVLDVAKAYIEAGADMIQADSFGGTAFKLQHFHQGLESRVAEINEAASKISREAAGDSNWTIPSVGPTGVMLMMGEVSEEALYEGFKEQMVALEKGGADAFCIETMSALDEALVAVRAAKENCSCEIICTFTFDKTSKGYRTMMGVSPGDFAKSMVEAGVDIIGTNCGNGIAGMIEIVREMRQVDKDIPILVHANAGLPKNVSGVDVFPEGPEEMAAQVPQLVEAGANIVGGCCGTTPAHISAIKKAIQG
ncbi:MAG: homocysteine S-methyltransferase family protein [Candidatus Sumerlaeia bacterium]